MTTGWHFDPINERDLAFDEVKVCDAEGYDEAICQRIRARHRIESRAARDHVIIILATSVVLFWLTVQWLS